MACRVLALLSLVCVTSARRVSMKGGSPSLPFQQGRQAAGDAVEMTDIRGGPSGAPALEPCLCVFDIDRTLTGQQGLLAPQCAHNQVAGSGDIYDAAYGGGMLTLSQVGKSLHGTFCAKRRCYLGIVSAGAAGGNRSSERSYFTSHWRGTGGQLLSSVWSGPSGYAENRRACTVADAQSPLVLGCAANSKPNAVEGVRQWYNRVTQVAIHKKNVWHFDDRKEDVESFRGSGFNAVQVSCSSRELWGCRPSDIGRCGATFSAIAPVQGVELCPPNLAAPKSDSADPVSEPDSANCTLLE